MLQYLINTTAVWLISLVLFDLFLKKESYHSYNRFYLLFTFSLGALLPLWEFVAGKSSVSLDTLVTSRPQLMQWLVIGYLCGALVAFGLLIIDIAKLVVFYHRGEKTKQDGWTIVSTGKDHPPFSYLDVLYIPGRDQYSETEWALVLAHEQRHSTLLHLVDMLLMQLARIALWFHPLVYIYQARLLLVHEYQADKAGENQPQLYGKFLVEQAMLRPAPYLSHSFNRLPIKNRIVILAKNLLPRTGTSNLKLLLIVPLTFVCIFFFANTGYSLKPAGAVWKKQVTRIIDFRQPDDTVIHHLRDASPDTTLLEMLITSVLAGKLTAYSNFDHQFTTKLTPKELTEQIIPRPDTMILTDPVTGREITKVVKHDFDYSVVHKYRVLEEWTYDQRTRKTEIVILGIAPIKDIFVENVFRGTQAMFWFRYNDIQGILARYELFHPTNTMSELIWKDNFDPNLLSATHP